MTQEEIDQENRRMKYMATISTLLALSGGYYIFYTITRDFSDQLYLLEETKEIDDKINKY